MEEKFHILVTKISARLKIRIERYKVTKYKESFVTSVLYS